MSLGRDEIITLPSGTEISVEAAIGDLQRASSFLASTPGNYDGGDDGERDEAQEYAADLKTIADLIEYLVSRGSRDGRGIMKTVKIVLAVEVAPETAEEICGTPISWDTVKPVLLDAQPAISVLGEIFPIEDES